MDFKETNFVNMGRTAFSGEDYSSSDSAEFLGLGNKKIAATAQNEFEQDLLNRYPFSLDCAQQTKIVNDMLAESARTLEERNSARKNSSNRQRLSGKLTAFDQYIPQAKDFMNTVACAVPVTPPPDPAPVPTPATPAATDPVINSAVVPDTLKTTNAAAAALPGKMSDTMKYSLIGLGALIVIVAGVVIIKKN